MEYSAGGYSASDHTSFVTKKIPVLFFFSGLHADYHKPSDTWDKINAPSAAQLLDMVGDVRCSWRRRRSRRSSSRWPKTSQRASSGGGGGYGPYFGSIPDFGEVKDGVRFSDVRPGSPAAKAGLKAGDILVQFGDKPIHNLYDFTDALRRSKVGTGGGGESAARRQAADGEREAGAEEVILIARARNVPLRPRKS